ncbi:response regulator, partial [Bradyrhizobium sp. UFLA 03-164]|nr:response regulator [Bradyrhizobium uaiense]
MLELGGPRAHAVLELGIEAFELPCLAVELGETLVAASSGREALEFLLKNEVAVILVDVCMPELDGFELA